MGLEHKTEKILHAPSRHVIIPTDILMMKAQQRVNDISNGHAANGATNGVTNVFTSMETNSDSDGPEL